MHARSRGWLRVALQLSAPVALRTVTCQQRVPAGGGLGLARRPPRCHRSGDGMAGANASRGWPSAAAGSGRPKRRRAGVKAGRLGVLPPNAADALNAHAIGRES